MSDVQVFTLLGSFAVRALWRDCWCRDLCRDPVGCGAAVMFCRSSIVAGRPAGLPPGEGEGRSGLRQAVAVIRDSVLLAAPRSGAPIMRGRRPQAFSIDGCFRPASVVFLRGIRNLRSALFEPRIPGRFWLCRWFHSWSRLFSTVGLTPFRGEFLPSEDWL